jgi:hypothetical protein
MPRVIVDAGQPFDDHGDARQSPEIGAIAMSPRSLAQSLLDPPLLGRIQFRFTAGPAGASQRLGSAPLPLFVPPTDALSAHLEVSSNRRQDQLTGREQARGALAPLLQSPKISPRTILSSHTTSIRSLSAIVTILCEAQ